METFDDRLARTPVPTPDELRAIMKRGLAALSPEDRAGLWRALESTMALPSQLFQDMRAIERQPLVFDASTPQDAPVAAAAPGTPGDLMATAEPWLWGTGSSWTGASAPPAAPGTGWPATLPQGVVARALLFWLDPSPVGNVQRDYQVSWEGEGDFDFEGATMGQVAFARASTAHGASMRMGHLRWMGGGQVAGLVLVVRATNPANPLRAMRVFGAPPWAQ
jgi:hypothetical protein